MSGTMQAPKHAKCVYSSPTLAKIKLALVNCIEAGAITDIGGYSTGATRVRDDALDIQTIANMAPILGMLATETHACDIKRSQLAKVLGPILQTEPWKSMTPLDPKEFRTWYATKLLTMMFHVKLLTRSGQHYKLKRLGDDAREAVEGLVQIVKDAMDPADTEVTVNADRQHSDFIELTDGDFKEEEEEDEASEMDDSLLQGCQGLFDSPRAAGAEATAIYL